jgi:hypothetical protein
MLPLLFASNAFHPLSIIPIISFSNNEATALVKAMETIHSQVLLLGRRPNILWQLQPALQAFEVGFIERWCTVTLVPTTIFL